MSARIEFFFDVSSPWTYLAFSRIGAVAERTGAPVDWRPILVGGVFNAVNQDLYETRANPNPVKARYLAKDLQDWARHCGLVIRWPDVFPVRAVEPMRAVLAAEEKGALVALADGFFRAYWREGRDISQHNEIEAVARAAGLDPAWLAARRAAPDIKARLRRNTDELIERGGFGSPTLFVDGNDMYFGNDRLPLVEAAAARAAGRNAPDTG